MANHKDLRDLHRQLVSDGIIDMGYKQFESIATAKGKDGVQNRQDLYNIAKEGGYHTGSYKDFADAYFVPVTPQKKEQMKQQVRQATGRQQPTPQKPAATPQGQKPKPVQQPTPNKPDSVSQQYMPKDIPDPTAKSGQISRVRPPQGTGVLKRDSQIMADDTLSAADKVALINDNRRRRGQRERDFNDYQEAARDAGVNMSNPVEGFTESVEARFQPDHFFTDSEGNVLDYKPDNYVNKSPVTQYNDRIKEIADEINYYNTKQDQGGGGTTRIEDAINAAYDRFVEADVERTGGSYWNQLSRALAMTENAGIVQDAVERGALREKYAGLDAVAEAAYNSFPDEVKQKYGEDAVYSAIYQATLSAMQDKVRPNNFGEYLSQKLISTVPAILYKAAVRANAGGRTTLSDIADMETAKYEQELDKQGFGGQVMHGIGTGVSFVADPTMYIPFGGGAGNLVGRAIASTAAKQAVGRGLEAGAVKLATKAAGSKFVSRGLVHGVSGGVQMAAYEEALGLANMANGSGQNFWEVTGEALETGAIMVPLGFVSQGARVVKGRTATAIADKGLSRGAQWAANTGAKLGINTTAFIAEAGIFASPDLIKMAVNGTYTNEQARDVVNHSIASLAGIKVAGAFNPTHIEQTMQQVRSVVKGTMGTELALDRHDSEALERLGYPKIQGDNIMSLFMPLGERPQAREGGGYFSMYSQIVLDERVPWSTRAKLIYVATGMLPETGVRPNQVRKTTDENGRIVVTTLQGNNPISQRFFDKKHSASADSYLRKVSHDVERMQYEGTKQDIVSEYLGGIARSQMLNDALAKDPKSRTPEEQKLVDDYNHEVWVAEDLMAGYARRTVMYDDKLPDPEKALKKPAWVRSEQEQRAVERYGVALNNRLDEIRSNNYSQIAFDLADKDSFDATKEMVNKQDGFLYQCQLRGEEGVWYTVVDFDGTIEQGETGMDVTPGANGDKMMVRNMSTGETKMVTLAELTTLSTDRYFDVRNSLTDTFYNNYLNDFLESRRKLSFFGKQPQNAEVGERLTLAADGVDQATGLRPEYVVIDKDGNSGTYIVEDAQGNRKLINGHDILQKITDAEPQIPTQIAPQVPPTGPQTPPPAAPAQEPAEQPQGEGPAMPEQGDVFKLKVGDEFKDAEVIGKDDTGIIVRYEDNGMFRTEHLTPEELAPRLEQQEAPAAPATPPAKPETPQEPPKGEGEPPKPEEPGKPAGEPAGAPAASEPHQLTVDEINGLNISQSTKENAIDYVNGDRGPRARVAYQVALKEWERVNGKGGEGEPETPPTTPEGNGPQEPPRGGGSGTTGRGGGRRSAPRSGGGKPAEPKPESEGPKDGGDDIDLGGLDELGGFEGLFGKRESNENRRPSREGEIVNEARYIPEEATEEQNRAVEKVIDVLAGIGKQLLEKKSMRTQSELVDFMRKNKQIKDALDRIGFDEEDKSNLYNDMWGQRIDTPNGRMRLNEYADELSKTDKPKQDDKPKQVVSPMEPTVKNIVYQPNSKGKTNESIIPASMAQVVKTALGRINGGDTDGFVMDKVGFKDKDELYGALNAEQIDGVALAISAIERGEGLILGDMTGIGKGRQLAAVIRYARKEGIRPVFVTEKPGLFKDMMRDLLDVGADTPNKPFRPLILASEGNGTVTLADGSTVNAADAKTIEKLLSGDLDKLAKGYDALFVTYANLNSVLPEAFVADQNAAVKEKTHNEKTETREPSELTRKKLNLVAKWARGSVVVMDEAHNAAGVDSTQAIQWREIIDTTSGVNAKGVVMASATYAKTPKNYVLYALRTPIKEAHLSNNELLMTFARGGVPLQEWLAGQLTGESYIRRERDMTGVNFDYRICVDGYDAEHPEKSTPEALEKVKAIRKSNDQAAKIANIMLALDNKASEAFKKLKEVLSPGKGKKGGAISVLVQQADGTYKEEMVDARMYPEALKMSNSTFASKIAMINAQLFMAEKAESAADAAIMAIKNGELPMIVFENTFDSLMDDLPVDEKGVLESVDYAQAFVRYLEQLGNFTIKLPKKNANGAQEVLKCRIDLSGDPDFALAKRMIETEGVGLHVSPVDRIRERLEAAGYKVGELSGRKNSIQKLADGKYHRVKRKTEDPDKVTDDYNTGKIDVLLINASGSTGRSMHEKGTWSEDGKEKIPGTTQSGEKMLMRPRHQIYVQNFSNETTMVQAMGRIDRTGQVEHGKYTFLMTPVPAETNILMRAQRKREQLKANTTAQQDRNSFDAVNASDFINKYGDEVVAEYLENNPKIANALQIPLKVVRDGTGRATSGLAKKATANAYTLTCDQQQEFYDDVQAAYDEYVKVLKENGDYDLETQVVDLQAETIADHMFVRGSHESDSMFSQDTNIARCRVKVQRKPMKVEEIEQHIAEVTGAEDKYEYEEKFQEKFDKHFADMEAEVEKEFETKEKNVDNDGKKNDKLGKIRAFKAEAQRLVKDFPLDLLMPFYADTSEVNDAQGRITTESMPHAIVYDVKLGRTLGSSTIVFAVNDGRQKVSVRMNDDATFRYLRRLQIMPAEKFGRSEWNKSQGDAYEDAFIITGNLIGAYHSPIASRGRMIRYTDSEGNLHTGILMPRNFKTKDVTIEKPISEFYNQFKQFARFRHSRKDELPVFAGGQLEVENTHYTNEFCFSAKGELARRIDKDPELEIYRTGKTVSRYRVFEHNDNTIQKVLGILAGRYGVSASVPIDPAHFMTREERDAEAESRMFRVEENIEEMQPSAYSPYSGMPYVVHVPKERRKNVDATSDWLDKTIEQMNNNGLYGRYEGRRTNESGKRVYSEFYFQNKAMAEEFVKMVNNEPVRPLAIDEKVEVKEPNWEEVDRSQHTYRLARPYEQLTGDDIAKTFGFRGVDTRSTNAEGVRDFYNAFMTMAMLLNIDPKSISLGGNMDVNMLNSDAADRVIGKDAVAAFMKRGKANSYTGATQKGMVFREGGSVFPIAHEWLHALDNYFGAFGLKNEETGFYEQTRMASESADRNKPWTARPEMRAAWVDLLKTLISSGYYGRLENEHFFKGSNFTDSSIRPQYWGKRTEMLARAFEAYMRKKITENEDNLSIVGGERMRDMISDGSTSTSGEFDPTEKEQYYINNAFDRFFETIKEKRDPDTGRVIMYEQAKQGETRRESTMRETRNLNRVLARTGLANSVTVESERDFAEGVFANTGRPLRTLDGIVYGYTDSEGNIHLNAKYLNFETPIHEYGHLWSAWAKKNHGDLWQRGIELAKESDAFKRLKEESKKKGSVYNGMTDDQLADEVLADAIGKKGQDMYDPKDWTKTARVRHWLTQLWHRIGEALGFRKRMPNMAVGDMSFDDIIRTAAGDILSGKRLKGTKGKGEIRFSSEGREFEVRERFPNGEVRETWERYPNGEVREVVNYNSAGDITRVLRYDENGQLVRHYQTDIGTDWELDENGVARGMSNGVEIRPYNFRFQQAPANNPAGSHQGNNEQLHIARDYAQDRTRANTRLYEEMVENTVSLRHVLEDIARKSGKPIADYENVYLAENQSHGMMTTELITFRDRRVQPLLDQLRKLAKNYGGEATKNYVWARHGIERSIYICFRERAYELAEAEAEAAARARGEEVTDQDINDAYNAMLDELYNATSGYSRRAYLENLETDCANILSAHGDTKPFEVTDKAGLTALNDKRSLVDDKPIENAWEIVKEYENNAGTEGEADVEALFDRLNDISKSMLDYSRDKGMMDKDTVEKIRKMFRFYVPLQGFAEGTMAQDYFEYVDSNPMRAGRAVPNTPKMRGRTGESADPIATLVRNAEMTIAAARRNTVATHLYNLATSRDTDLFAPARAWEAYDAAEDTWVPSTPDFTGCETTKDMMDAIRLHDEQMRQQRELGLAREARRGFSNRLITAQGAPKGLKMSMRQRHEHAVPVRINGKENVIYVLSDPRIAQIVNGTDKGSVDKSNAPFFYQANKLKRIQSGLMTSYNIAFWFANGARDIQNAFLRQAIMNSGGAAARTAGAGLKGDPFGVIPWEAMRLYNKAVKGTLDESNKHERYFKEFFEHGGITGYAFADQVEVIQSRVKKLLEHPRRNPRRLMFAVGEMMEKAGGAFEIAPRFATYVASRDGGKSVMQSVADAKEATVNFDRRGARRTWLMRAAAAFYAFLNPGIQGMQNRLHMWRTQPTKTTLLHAAGFAMGYLWKGIAVACLASLGRKDDEYDTQLTDHDRRNNICIPVGDDDWVKIPIDMEDRVLFGLGDATRNGLDFFKGNRYIGGKGADDYGDGTDWTDYAGIISAWLPIDLGSENNWVPTSLQPIYDVYINRKDWRGNAVDWRNDYNAQSPEYQRVNPYVTGKAWTNASKWWSEAGGGDEVQRADGWHEVNPQHMQYMFQSYLGGIGTTVGQVMSLVETIGSDEDDVKYNSFKFPIANRFWKGNLNEYTAGEGKKARIWTNWANEISRRDREYRKRGAGTENSTLSPEAQANYEENLRYLELAKEIERLARKKSTAKSKATKEGRTLTSDETKELDNAFNEHISEFEDKFMEIDGKRKVPKWRKHYDD